jgi:hypothetical protein
VIALGYVQLLLQSGAIIFVHDSAGKLSVYPPYGASLHEDIQILAIFGNIWRYLEILVMTWTEFMDYHREAQA